MLAQLHDEQGHTKELEKFALAALNGYKEIAGGLGILIVSIAESMRYLKCSRYADAKNMFEIAEKS